MQEIQAMQTVVKCLIPWLSIHWTQSKPQLSPSQSNKSIFHWLSCAVLNIASMNMHVDMQAEFQQS